MSIIADLNPYIEQFQPRVRAEKNAQGLTNQQLIDTTGVSAYTVNTFLSGGLSDPKLFNSIAICKALGLSVDELFGLTPESSEKLHELELENARLTAEREAQKSYIRGLRTFAFVLAAICAVLSVALVIYLLIDFDIRDAGLIRYGEPTPYAWIVISVIVASVLFSAFCAIWTLAKSRRR